MQAHLGTVSLLGVGGSPVKLGLRRVVLHPRYNPGILDFDVALLELAQPLVFNKYIQPVCLPLAIHKFPVGRKCMISGWGNMQEGNGEQILERDGDCMSGAGLGGRWLSFPHLGPKLLIPLCRPHILRAMSCLSPRTYMWALICVYK